MERTQAEIAARIEKIKVEDFFGTQTSDLLFYLDFKHAKPFLKDAVAADEWSPTPKPPLDEAREYFEFAYGKCIDHRGLSAGRSIEHFRSWFWLAGDDETVAFLEDDSNYAQYGAPMLKRVAGRLDIPVPDSEDFRRMAEGNHCSDDCCEGCGN